MSNSELALMVLGSVLLIMAYQVMMSIVMGAIIKSSIEFYFREKEAFVKRITGLEEKEGDVQVMQIH